MNKPLSYIEISRGNLIHNFKHLKSYLHPYTKIACVVKANAYGHGLKEVVEVFEPHADYFQVDDLLELKSLREVSSKPTLVFGYVSKDELEEALNLDATLAMYDLERLELLNSIAGYQKKKAKVHIKVDAYLGRQGVMMDELEDFIYKLKLFENIDVEGVYSHFANIEDTTDFYHAQKQIDAYVGALKMFEQNGFRNIQKHISATSGILVYEKDTGSNEIVRPGIGLYGLWPSEDLRITYKTGNLDLKPVMRWVTHIAQVKMVPANYSIGYGLTFITSKATKIAIIPQGYSDGYDRGLSNKGHVLINGQRCLVLGRIAMNMFAVDVTGIKDAKLEDEVVLLGKQGTQQITAEELAQHADTINYEIVARVSSLLPRRLVD